MAIVNIVGNAKGPIISRVCYCCKNIFVMTAEDYVFNKCGMKVIENNPDMPFKKNEEFVCSECAEEILRIREL